MKRFLFAACAAALMLGSFTAAAEAASALITELKKGKGSVEVRKVGQEGWQAARPLQALDSGDMLRASEDGYAMIVYSSVGKTVRVSASNSPVGIAEPRQQDKQSAKAEQVFRSIAGFLSGTKAETLSAPMTVRKLSRPPAIISPKNTKILPGALPVFEWMGPPRTYYRVLLSVNGAVIWTSEQVSKTRFAYPGNAPALVPSATYSWSLETQGSAPGRAEFSVASAEEKRALELDLGMLGADQGALSATAAVLRYGILAERGFHSEARAVLMNAIDADPDEPSLHMLLAECYRHAGLNDLAAEEDDEADFLLRKAP